jgi:hypothetical protein
MKKTYVNILVAAYRSCDWLRGKILGLMIRATHSL